MTCNFISLLPPLSLWRTGMYNLVLSKNRSWCLTEQYTGLQANLKVDIFPPKTNRP